MKEQKKKEKPEVVLTKESLLRRNPIPYGDVRKYYLGAKVGTVILFAILFFVSVIAIALRTEYIEQISNGNIVFLLLFTILSIVGIYWRSLLGYALSAVSSLGTFLILQYGSGRGVQFTSLSLSYGEDFVKGIQSMVFWIIVSKILTVIHLALSFVFINSTVKVTEEPSIEGMNIPINQFRDWLYRTNDSLPAGRRPLDYWFAVASVLLFMAQYTFDFMVTKYDYYALVLFTIGMLFIPLRQITTGSLLILVSSLIRCSMYQYRYGMFLPVIVAYVSVWLDVVYLIFASRKMRETHDDIKECRWITLADDLFMWEAVFVAIMSFPVHQILADFTGSETMSLMQIKDNLPILFFVPVAIFLLIRCKKWYGYVEAAAMYIWFWYTLRQSPYAGKKLIVLDYEKYYGSAGVHASKVLMKIVDCLAILSLISCGFCLAFAAIKIVTEKRGKKHGNEKE